MMFPPIDEAVLQNNPKFATLYKTLTTRILNPDGSSKDPATAEREARAEALQAHGLRAIKTEILRSALKTVPLTAQKPPLPSDLIELIILLSLKLSTSQPLSPSANQLLTISSPYDTLPTYIPQISALLSAHLHKQALGLARVLNPTTNASFLHRQIPKLPSSVKTLVSDINTKKQNLEKTRLALVPLITKILEQYREAIVTIIRILEQHKHGQLSRSVKQKAEMLSLEAAVEQNNVIILTKTAQGLIYTPEVNSALRNYHEHLRDARRRLKQRKKDAERELERYGVGRAQGNEATENKEKVMREIARVYGDIGRQIEDVERDLERLKAAR